MTLEDYAEKAVQFALLNGSQYCDVRAESVQTSGIVVENGELRGLLRDVIVMGNSAEFFESIDARGKDFTVRPIANCGKGDPMQVMRMGNGGPHIRGKSIVKSVTT